MIIILAWFAFSIGIGAIASSKGRSVFGFVLLSLLLSPLVGLIVVLLVSTNRAAIEARDIDRGEMKKCPHCAELVKAEAAICRYCGRELATPQSRAVQGIVVDEGFTRSK